MCSSGEQVIMLLLAYLYAKFLLWCLVLLFCATLENSTQEDGFVWDGEKQSSRLEKLFLH